MNEWEGERMRGFEVTWLEGVTGGEAERLKRFEGERVRE